MILHRQLKALLHHLGVEAEHPPDEDRWLALLVLLNDRFRQFEDERHRLQRSLEIHSREVQSLYKELTQERDKVSSILECLDQAILLIDGQGRLLLISAEAELRLGLMESELEGKNLLAVLGLEPYLPPGGLPAFLSGLRPVELSLAVRRGPAKVETEVRLQPLIRDRQLIGCLVQLSDPLPNSLTEEDVPAVPQASRAARASHSAEVGEALHLPKEPVPLPSEPPLLPLGLSPPGGLGGETPLRVLLVESNPELTQSSLAALEELQHICLHTSEGEEAVELYQQQAFDAILCCEDPLGLPGLDLCKRLRQDSRGSYPYFILMTPNGPRQQAPKALEAGVDAFLSLPLEVGELKMRLKVARGVQSRLSKVYSNFLPKTQEQGA